MAGVELATAYISLNVNTSKVKSQVESAFERVSGKDAGRRVGDDFAGSVRSRLAGSRWVSKALEDASKGAGSGSARKFFSEFQTTSQRVGAVTGLVIGKTIGLGITAGMRTMALGGAIFAKLEVAAKASAVRMGAAMATAIRSALSATGVGLGITGLMGVGGMLTAGLDRLRTLQKSQVQLSLKLSPQDVKQVQKDITEVVQGIPVNLDQAMAAVPKALNSGVVKQGEDLKQYIRDIANATASSGGQAEFAQVDLIFGQIIAKGKLMGEELMQLTENGIDMRNALKEAFGWDDKTLNRNIEKGKVGINEMRVAVQKVWGKDGGLAVKMNETFDGAAGTLRATVARIGAGFIGAIFGDPNNPDSDPMANAAEGITNINEKLKGVEQWVADNRGNIHGFFKKAGDIIGGVGGAVGKVIDWLGKFKNTAGDVIDWFGRAWDSGVTAVKKVGDTVKNTFETIKTKISEVFDATKKLWDDIFGENGWFAQKFQWVKDLIDKVKGAVGMATANAAPGSAPFNPGPKAPGARTGSREPGWGGAPTAPQATLGVPSSSPTGAPIYTGPRTENTGGGVHARTAQIGALIEQLFPGSRIGNDYRVPDGFNEHSSGESADIMISNDGTKTAEGLALGDKINEWLLSHAEQVGLQYTIWKGMQWNPQRNADGSWVTSPNAGQGITGGHWDHIHPRFTPGAVDPETMKALAGITDTPPMPTFTPPGQGQPNGPSTGAGMIWDWMRNQFGFAGGGGVFGAGTATSDSIPAMLSNGEHVLSAKDVKKMGGQQNVYAFRALLGSGLIPGFAPGGAVEPIDPNKIRDLENRITDLQNQQKVADLQRKEMLDAGDVTEVQQLQSDIGVSRLGRDMQSAVEELNAYKSGTKAPDRSLQNNIYDTTDAARLAQAQLDEAWAKGDLSASQMEQMQYDVQRTRRERDIAVQAALNPQQGPDKPASFLDNMLRTQGFTPSGSGGEAGTSSLSGFINMGNEVVGGLIDTGASLASSAISAATSAAGGAAAASAGPGGPMAGMIANAAAQYGIQLGAAQMKRISSYWFGLAGIGADALIAQMFPFGGPPRAIGYDYAGMTPQLGIQQAALTTLEQMGQKAISDYFNPQQKQDVNVPGLPASFPKAGSAQTQLGGPAQQNTAVGAPAPVPTQGSAVDSATADLFDPSRNPQTTPPPPPGDFSTQYPWFKNQLFGYSKGGHVGIYDSGGVLEPGDIAVNKSKIPEKVLTQKQWDAMANLAVKGGDAPMVKIDAIYGMSPEDVATQIEQRQRLAAMQFGGRPY